VGQDAASEAHHCRNSNVRRKAVRQFDQLKKMDKELSEEDWDQYYTVLGKFIVNFENIVFDIREDSSFLVQSMGLKDAILGQIIFGQKSFTAEPLISCYVTIVNHIVNNIKEKDKEREKKILIEMLNDLKTKFSKLVEVRNDIVHSTHFFVESIVIVGPLRLHKDFKAYKPSPKKTGYHLKKTLRTEIIQYTYQLKNLRKEFKGFISELHKFIETNKLIES